MKRSTFLEFSLYTFNRYNKQKYEREQTFKESKAPREGFLPDVKTDVRTLKSASRERMRSMTELEKIYGSK